MGKLILTIIGLGLEGLLWVNLLGTGNQYRQKLGWKYYLIAIPLLFITVFTFILLYAFWLY